MTASILTTNVSSALPNGTVAVPIVQPSEEMAFGMVLALLVDEKQDSETTDLGPMEQDDAKSLEARSATETLENKPGQAAAEADTESEIESGKASAGIPVSGALDEDTKELPKQPSKVFESHTGQSRIISGEQKISESSDAVAPLEIQPETTNPSIGLTGSGCGPAKDFESPGTEILLSRGGAAPRNKAGAMQKGSEEVKPFFAQAERLPSIAGTAHSPQISGAISPRFDVRNTTRDILKPVVEIPTKNAQPAGELRPTPDEQPASQGSDKGLQLFEVRQSDVPAASRSESGHQNRSNDERSIRSPEFVLRENLASRSLVEQEMRPTAGIEQTNKASVGATKGETILAQTKEQNKPPSREDAPSDSQTVEKLSNNIPQIVQTARGGNEAAKNVGAPGAAALGFHQIPGPLAHTVPNARDETVAQSNVGELLTPLDGPLQRIERTQQPPINVAQQGQTSATVRQVIEAMPNRPNQPVEISLNPEELGRVRMVLTGNESQISVSIIAERAETTDLMRRHLDLLAEQYKALGYNDISFSFGGQDGGNNDPEPASRQESSHDRNEPDQPQVSTKPVKATGIDIRF